MAIHLTIIKQVQEWLTDVLFFVWGLGGEMPDSLLILVALAWQQSIVQDSIALPQFRCVVANCCSFVD